MGEIAEEHDISITRACRLMGIHKSFFYYESTKDDSEVEAAIRQKAEQQAKAVAQTLVGPCQESARDTGPRKYHLVDGLRY